MDISRELQIKIFRYNYEFLKRFLDYLNKYSYGTLGSWTLNVKPLPCLFQSFVLEIVGTNVSTTFITCPADPKKTLGIKLPYLVMIVKNMKKYFTFEVQVLDDKNVRRRFRASNYQSTTRVKPFICTMPMRLDEGWNQIQFNLADFTRHGCIFVLKNPCLSSTKIYALFSNF